MSGLIRRALVVALVSAIVSWQIFQSSQQIRFMPNSVDLAKHQHHQDSDDKSQTQVDRENGQKDTAFLDLPITFQSEPRDSIVHCVGSNFLPKTAAGYRSCAFHNLCWHVFQEDFVLLQSPQHQYLSNLLHNMTSNYSLISSSFHTQVALAGTHEQLLRQGKANLWFPRTMPQDNQGFWQLPADTVLLPVIFPANGNLNAKDMVWDFLLPIYNLLVMFDFHQHQQQIWVVNMGFACSSNHKCYSEALEILSLLHPKRIIHSMTNQTQKWAQQNQAIIKDTSPRICADYGVAGIGALTDHGIHKKSHGERQKDYVFSQNTGRGPLLFEFRKHVLDKLGIGTDKPVDKSLPLRVTISISESKKSGLQDFASQMEAIQHIFPAPEMVIKRYNFATLPVKDQVSIAAESDIYISVMGNGAWPAMFMPRNSTLILFYNDQSELVSVSKRDAAFPVKLDWDIWNNLAYLRVHWLPLSTKDQEEDKNQLMELLREGRTLRMSQNLAMYPAAMTKTDGAFNGIGVRFVNRTGRSSAHCVGNNFLQGAHVFRSCQYRYLCLNTSAPNRNLSFIVPHDQPKSLRREPLFFPANNPVTVSIGHTVRFHAESEWSPLPSTGLLSGFYELPSYVVWVPFHAEQPNINNPGHLLWDYFLPFFNLLQMFGLDGHRLLLTNVDKACTKEENDSCWKLMTKFIPLMDVIPDSFRNLETSILETKQKRQSDMVCARTAIAGIGMLTDHGWNRHGQRVEDYRDSHNIGRGPSFFAFRKFVLQNMGVQEKTSSPHDRFQVVFSKFSSKNPSRRLSFDKQLAALQKASPSLDINTKQLELSQLPLYDQVKLATETSVFVSVVGGSACTAMFMPRGSTIILFFNDVNEFVDHSPRKDFPSMIDWDFWNNAAYLRVHWLPLRTMNDDADIQVLTELIRNDLATQKIARI